MPCQQYTAIDTILVSPLAFVATLLLLILAIVTNSSAPLALSGSNLHTLILTFAPGDRRTLDGSHPLSTIGCSFATFTLLAAITLSGLCSLARNSCTIASSGPSSADSASHPPHSLLHPLVDPTEDPATATKCREI